MIFNSLRYIISISIVSVASSVQASEDFSQCFDVASLEGKADFDFNFYWVQPIRSVSPRPFDEVSGKALQELSQRLANIGTKLVVAIEPTPLAGAPSGSSVLQGKSNGWRLEYDRLITSIRETGVSIPDLSVIYDNGRAPEEIQRKYDHHLTGRGAWLSGAAIAAEMNGVPESFEDYATQLDELEQRSIEYGPSDFVSGLMVDGCDPKNFRTDDFIYVSQQSADADSLFGEETDGGAILIGDSYSVVPEGALGTAIDEFYSGTIENFGIPAGGPLTSMSVILSTQLEKVLSSDWIVWQVGSYAMHAETLLAALMLVKGAELESCKVDSFLFSEGTISLDQNGAADLPILGVLEDSVTIHVPPSVSDTIKLTYNLYDGSKYRAVIDRNFSSARFLDGPIQDIHLGLVGNDWWGEENRVRSISIEYEAEGATVSEIGYTACWTRDGQH